MCHYFFLPFLMHIFFAFTILYILMYWVIQSSRRYNVKKEKQRKTENVIKMFLMASLPCIDQLIFPSFVINANVCTSRQLTYWNNWSLLTVSSRIWRKTKKTSTGLKMSSSSKRSFSLLSFRAAAVKRPSNFGFQLSTVELSGVLERRLRLLLVGSLDWRLALWCLLSASGLNLDAVVVLVSGLWILPWSGTIAEKILKFRCLSTSFSTANMLGNFSISMQKLMILMIAVHTLSTDQEM